MQRRIQQPRAIASALHTSLCCGVACALVMSKTFPIYEERPSRSPHRGLQYPEPPQLVPHEPSAKLRAPKGLCWRKLHDSSLPNQESQCHYWNFDEISYIFSYLRYSGPDQPVQLSTFVSTPRPFSTTIHQIGPNRASDLTASRVTCRNTLMRSLDCSLGVSLFIAACLCIFSFWHHRQNRFNRCQAGAAQI